MVNENPSLSPLCGASQFSKHIHSFIQPILMEHPMYARHRARISEPCLQIPNPHGATTLFNKYYCLYRKLQLGPCSLDVPPQPAHGAAGLIFFKVHITPALTPSRDFSSPLRRKPRCLPAARAALKALAPHPTPPAPWLTIIQPPPSSLCPSNAPRGS